MKILVTGGAGYIGSVLVSQLLDAGYQVTVFDNFFYRQNSLNNICYHTQFKIIIGDVRNIRLFKKQINHHDIIIPLAAIVGAPACEKDKTLATQINKVQIENIVKWISKDQMILFPVTNSGYGIGQKDKFCDENTPLSPISHYGKTKVNAEKLLLNYGNAITFRLATVFGVSSRMRMDLLVNDFVHRAFNDRFIVLFESKFMRNYIHIRDIGNVILHSIDCYEKMKGESYNVGLSNANLSKKDLCLKIKEYLTNFVIFESEIVSDPDKRDYIVSNDKIESTGWKPKFSLDMGIKELIKFYSYLQFNPHSNI